MKKIILTFIFCLCFISIQALQLDIYKIEYDIDKLNTSLRPEQIRYLAYALLLGEREYKIPYKDVLSIIAVESKFNPIVVRKNKNKTYDYGLCQINSRNWECLSIKAKEALYRQEAIYIDSKFDIVLNVMCAYVHLSDIRNHIIDKEGTYQHYIQAYNVGMNGTFSNNANIRNIRNNYFKKFYEVRQQI